MKTLKIIELLENLDSIDDSLCVYIAKGSWQNEDICLLMEQDEVDEYGYTYQEFEYSLGVFTLKEIVENIICQSPKTYKKFLNKAVLYYLENDSFLDITS